MLIALHKMNPSSKEIESSRIPKSTTFPSSSSTTPWLGLKDPRIVRVFGGKDRHSKVCTIKGLRDRRVRLSIPTAMQLYDLQERLGLNQPSKVVDWLLNAAKDGIDELPPLPIPPEHFALTHQPVHDPHEIFGSSKGINIAREKENSEGLLQDPQLTLMPSYGSFYPLETSNFSSFSQSAAGGDHLHIQNLDALPLPSTLLLSSGGGGGGRGFQTLVTQPYLSNSGENDSRQLINHQVMNPSIAYHPQGVYYSLGQSMRPIHFSVSPRINLQYSWRGNDVGGQEHHQPNKGQEFHFK